MSDVNVNFGSENLLTGVVWSGSYGFSQVGSVLNLSGLGEWCECQISGDSSFKYVKTFVSFALTGVSSVRYAPRLRCELICEYNDGRVLKIVDFLGDEAKLGKFSDENVHELFVGSKTMRVKFVCMATGPVSIEQYSMHKSIEISWDSILDVVEQATVSVEVIHSVLSWVDNLQVNTLETNLASINSVTGSSARRDYIVAKDRTIDFKEDTMTEELVQLEILAGGSMCPVFYTAIDKHEQAYKYVTLTDPRTIHKDLDDATYERYRYKVYKAEKSDTKLKIFFEDMTGTNGQTTGVPKIRFGEGTTAEVGDEVGCATIVKDFDGFELYYVKSDGKRVSIRMNEKGGFLDGFQVGLPLNDVRFYDDGFVCKHGEVTTKWKYKTSTDGRLVGLVGSHGVNVNIVNNSGNMPTA